MEYARPELLAEPDWLVEHLDDPEVRIIDCGTPDAYRRAHIPGAAALPVHNFIKERDPGGSDHGVLVMPPAEFEALMDSLGVGDDTTVVTYDDDNARVAARLWWVLKYYGHSQAKVLNGGWHRWITEARPITFHPLQPEPRTFTARPQARFYASLDYLMGKCTEPGFQVLDARSDGEWLGTESRGNRRVGHVPNAVHLEWVNFVSRDDMRRFLSAPELQKLLDEAGISRGKPVITYCQGGIRAAHAAFVLELLGYDDVRVYDGSMREWANRDDTLLVL